MFQLLSNYVLILPDYEHFEGADVGGQRLDINVNFEREIHFPSSGTVIKAPKKLFYSNLPEDREQLLWHTTMDIQEGDKVIFGYNLVPQAITHNKCMGPAVYIKYDELFCAVRGEKLIMLNGYVAVEAVEDLNPVKDFSVPDHLQSINHFHKGKVFAIGNGIKKYRMYPELGGDDPDQLSEGDIVLFHMQHSIPLQYQMHSIVDSGKELYRMQQKDIQAVYDRAGV